MKAALPPDEAARLKALQEFEILDTAPEVAFDDLALLASHLCGTPVALITLLDEERQWFKSKVGMDLSETPRELAFCAHTILQKEVLAVEDATQDARFADNPFVTGEAHIRFYAGAPMITSAGHAIGTLCVIDQVPRQLTHEQMISLQALSRVIVTQLEWRRGVAELRRSNELARLLGTAVHQSKESIVITDAQLDLPGPRIVFVNPAYTQMTGYSAGEAIGKTPRVLQGPLTDRTVLDRLRHNLENGEMFAGETVNYRKDGTPFDLEWQIAPIRDLKGVTTHFVAVQHDITERKKAHEALRLSEEMLRGVMDSSHDCIKVLDLGGRLIWMNEGGQKVMEIDDFTAVQDEMWTALWPVEERSAALSALELAKKNSVGTFTGFCPTAKGTPRWWDVVVTPMMNDAGVMDKILAVSRDVTARKTLEIHLFQAQKLETVGKLAGGIAHEFNSIMTAIIGQSELLVGNLPAGSPFLKNVTEISQSANRAAALTRQLLAYGRKQILQPELLDLNVVLSNMDTVLRATLGASVELHFTPAAELRTIKADAGQIQQVLINLAMNAADAMPHGGTLAIATTNLTLDEAHGIPGLKPGEYVTLTVSDTGTGMSEAIQARVFEPFFSTKEVGQGTGLGLATCYGIIKQSGGHITVQSLEDQGTTFTIYLPQAASAATLPPARPKSPASQQSGHGAETILLVEEDAALREMAGSLLGRLGYFVLATSNSLGALSLAQHVDRGPVDLLITDVNTPQMTGGQLAAQIQAFHPQAAVLITSIYAANTLLNPGVAFLQKPFSPATLIRKIRETLDQRPRPLVATPDA